VHRATVAVYEDHAATYLANRTALDPGRAERFAAAVTRGARRLDLGSGPGHYLGLLGTPVVALDAAPAMLVEARRLHPQAPGVAADFEELPFRTGSFGGIWANKCLQHVDPGALPLVLGELRRVLDVGGRLGLLVFAGEGEATSDDDLPGRYFAWWDPERLADVVAGAGFGVDEVAVTGTESAPIALTATRLRSLPDTVAPGMRLLVCGLNPSLYSADAGVPFARTGNRFWRALAAAGLDDVDRDPRALLVRHRVGLTDIVKRATVAAAELDADEYRTGLARVHRLASWLRPEAICFVGLAGWRAAIDRTARAGWQPEPLGGVPAYVMPSTSGLNAATPLATLADHLRAALAGPPAAPGRQR
jgi:TDG/mug DNA glycosylase family protein